MRDLGYETVGPGERLTRGDIIFDCPLVSWSSAPIPVTGSGSEVEALKQGRVAFQADVMVMTQACDLEQEKVRNAVACPHLSLSDYKATWDEFLRQRHQNPTAKAWRTHCNDIKVSPCREHLSRAFARYFMRVGLPVPVDVSW
ncbi:MAG TPA: hypothetical protein VFF52_09550 [Isosphaeraceae bacterium]|nr:hypothetical protein [Isosphaeraceae bacterium]